MDTQGALESRGPGSSVGTGGGSKRPYEGSSSESVVSFATDSVSVAQNSVVSASGTNPDGRRTVKSSASTACRQRVTVVCAECKRLKLKCDRRTPCGSCSKRDTIPRCIYSQAAAEKVDVQSLNIRLQAVEGKLNGVSFPSESTATGAGHSNAWDPSSSSSAAPSSLASTASQPRAFLAVGPHGTSVAVNLEGVAGIWVDHLGVKTSAVATRGAPATIGELDLERMGAVTTRSGSGIELRPSPTIPANGVITFIEDYIKHFRIRPSFMTSSSDASEDAVGSDGDAEHDNAHVGEEREEEDSDQLGVSPELVHRVIPSADVRAEIYARFEEAHYMSPTVNFFVFKSRIEEMCQWAELELSASSRTEPGNMRRNEPPPITTTSSSASAIPMTLMPPTLSFFAAAALGLALGARCWLIERDVLGEESVSKSGLSSATDRAFTPGSTNGIGGLGSNTNFYDRSMPPPPPPGSSFENGTSTSPSSPPPAPSSSAPGPSNSRNQNRPPPQIDPSLPEKLYRLAKFALALSLETAGYEAFDLDYIHAKCLQVRYLLLAHNGLVEGPNVLRDLSVGRRRKIENRRRKAMPNGVGYAEGSGDTVMDEASDETAFDGRRKGKERAPARGPTLALAPELIGAVSDAVGNARMMGLNHDPELTSSGKFSVYEVEMRRRLWWEVVILDGFVAGCLGESPFINDNSATTAFPVDVDEESFAPDSANRPAPNIESLHGNIDHFIQRSRLTDLWKKLKRKADAVRELHEDARPSETHDFLEKMKNEIATWLSNLPDHLKLKDVPWAHPEAKMSPSSKKPPTSAAERENLAEDDSPHLIAMRCRLAISARFIFLMLCLPSAKSRRSDVKEVDSNNLTPSGKRLDALAMLEPAMYIVRTWKYMHSVMRNVHPALFMCYAVTRELFDSAVVLGHIAIEQPLFGSRALASLRTAGEILRDPSVLPSRPTADVDESGSLPSEAVRIIEELILKSETEAAKAGFSDGFGMNTPPIVKRKHEEVEASSSDLLHQFRFPFVAGGVVSAGPPAVNTNGMSHLASPLTDGGSAASTRTGESATKTSRSKHGTGATMDTSAVAGDPRPATSRLKSSHPTISVRNRKKESRARANSTASQRSDVSHMLPAVNPPSSRPPSNPHSSHLSHVAQNHVPPQRLTSVEPPAQLLPPLSYPDSLSPNPGQGAPHYTLPPGTTRGNSSSQQQVNGGGEFSSTGFQDTGGFHNASPASYGPPFQSQSGPSLPVPSQVAFDGFGMGSPDQGGGIPLGNGEPSAYAMASTTGLDRHGHVSMRQPAGFDPIGGLSHPPSEPPQDRPFSRNPIENRPQGNEVDNSMAPPMPSLEHQHSHSPLHPPQTYHPQQQGWTDYPSWSYFQ